MKAFAISDLHIYSHGDPAHSFFSKFIEMALISDAQKIYFLGDIFDMMVGSKQGYINDHMWYFEAILSLLDAGKEVNFIEGNHDFHLDILFKKYLKNKEFSGKFIYSKSSQSIRVGNKKIMLMHGDELDLDKKAYRRWKNIYSSFGFRIFVNNLLPYLASKWIGNRASKNSKKRNSIYFNFEHFKELYREKARIFFDRHSDVDILIAGHTHIKDNYEYNDRQYLNAGFPVRDNCYIFISDDQVEILPI